MYKRLYGLLFIVFCMVLTSACQDKVELEERGFIGAFSIDLEDRQYVLGTELITLPDSESKKNKNGKREIKKVNSSNFSTAVDKLNETTPKELNFALSKACIIGEDTLKDAEMLYWLANSLEHNIEISGKLIIMAAKGKASDVLEKQSSDDNSLGNYISNHYKHSRNHGGSAYQLELEELVNALREGRGVAIPLLSFDEANKTFEFKGAAMVKENLIEFVSENELDGMIWAKEMALGRLMSEKTDEGFFVYKVDDQDIKYIFDENNDKLTCSIIVRTSGTLEDHPNKISLQDKISDIENKFGQQIEKEIEKTYDRLNKYNIDGYSLTERLYKYRPDLYKKYGGINECDINVDVSVKINY